MEDKKSTDDRTSAWETCPKCMKIVWNICPACGEWWGTDEKTSICPECKEKGKEIKLIPTCAGCGKPIEKCTCKESVEGEDYTEAVKSMIICRYCGKGMEECNCAYQERKANSLNRNIKKSL